MRKFIKSLGLKEGADFDQLMARMKLVQDLRLNVKNTKTKSVDSTSALYAAGETNNIIKKVLIDSGLDWSAFETEIGINKDFDPLRIKKVHDINITERLKNMILEYQSTYPDRKYLDSLGLAAVILFVVSFDVSSSDLSDNLGKAEKRGNTEFHHLDAFQKLEDLITKNYTNPTNEEIKSKQTKVNKDNKVIDEAGLISEFEIESKIGKEEGIVADNKLKPRLEENVPTHSDAPAIEDKLDRLPFAEVIARRIDRIWTETNSKLEQDAKPSKDSDDKFTVHIHGPWGSGKTSILNMVCRTLKNGELSFGEQLNNEWVVIKFNAWKHQHQKPPWWTLINELYKQSLNQLPPWSKRSVEKEWFFWRLKADWFQLVVAIILVLIISYALMGVSQSGETSDIHNILRVIVTAGAVWGVIATTGKSLLFGSSKAAEAFTNIRTDPMKPIAQIYEKLIQKIDKPVAIFIDCFRQGHLAV